MSSLSDYRYWKFHFDCLKASNFRLEKPIGEPKEPSFEHSRVKRDLDATVCRLFLVMKICTHLFNNNLFIRTWGNKKTQNLRTFQEHAEAEERRRTLTLDTAQHHGNGLSFISTTSPVNEKKFFFRSFLFVIILFLQTRVASGWFEYKPPPLPSPPPPPPPPPPRFKIFGTTVICSLTENLKIQEGGNLWCHLCNYGCHGN